MLIKARLLLPVECLAACLDRTPTAPGTGVSAGVQFLLRMDHHWRHSPLGRGFPLGHQGTETNNTWESLYLETKLCLGRGKNSSERKDLEAE